MKVKVIKISILFLAIILGCQNNKHVKIVEIQRIDTLKTFNLFYDKNKPIEIAFNKNGSINYIQNQVGENRWQYIGYYENGNILSKIISDSLGKIHGRAYYFYERSGNLDSDYNFVNGVKNGNAVSYFDSTSILKSSMLYNDVGKMYWRQSSDKNQKIIKEEGKVGK